MTVDWLVVQKEVSDTTYHLGPCGGRQHTPKVIFGERIVTVSVKGGVVLMLEVEDSFIRRVPS